MIEIFATEQRQPIAAYVALNNQVKSWKERLTGKVKITHATSSANEYGFMLTIVYEII